MVSLVYNVCTLPIAFPSRLSSCMAASRSCRAMMSSSRASGMSSGIEAPARRSGMGCVHLEATRASLRLVFSCCAGSATRFLFCLLDFELRF